MMMDICIIGSGIAGLSAAVYLKKHGINSKIYERSDENFKGGYGFLLLENGLSALEKIGLREKVCAKGIAINEFILHNEFGNIIAHQKLNDILCIQRADLSNILRSCLSDSSIYKNYQFSNFKYDINGTAVSAVFKNKEEINADVFICADGTKSTGRSVIDPDYIMPESRIKEILFRIQMPNQLKNTFTKFQHSEGGLAIGILPIDSSNIIFYIQFDNHRFHMSKNNPKQFVQKLIKKFPSSLDFFTQNIDFTQLHIWHTTSMITPPKLFNKNIVLIGDAAHTFSPFSSQGINTALEDSLILSEILIKDEPLNDKLQIYAEKRLPEIQRYLNIAQNLMSKFLGHQDFNDSFLPLALHRSEMNVQQGAKSEMYITRSDTQAMSNEVATSFPMGIGSLCVEQNNC